MHARHNTYIRAVTVNIRALGSRVCTKAVIFCKLLAFSIVREQTKDKTSRTKTLSQEPPGSCTEQATAVQRAAANS